MVQTDAIDLGYTLMDSMDLLGTLSKSELQLLDDIHNNWLVKADVEFMPLQSLLFYFSQPWTVQIGDSEPQTAYIQRTLNTWSRRQDNSVEITAEDGTWLAFTDLDRAKEAVQHNEPVEL